MTFDDWFGEIENFSLRAERFYSELEAYRDGHVSADRLIDWLTAAYQVGHSHALTHLIDDGK